MRWQCPSCSPNLKLETPRIYSGAAFYRPETTEKPKPPPIPEVVRQQSSETYTDHSNLDNTNNESTQKISKTNVASQTWPLRVTQPQNYVVATEHPPGNQTRNEPVPFHNCSQNRPTYIQISEQHVTTTITGNTTIPPLTTATPLKEEGLVRDEQTNEVYLPLTSTVVLRRKHEMLYVPLDFENNLTVVALVDSGAFVSAIA